MDVLSFIPLEVVGEAFLCFLRVFCVDSVCVAMVERDILFVKCMYSMGLIAVHRRLLCTRMLGRYYSYHVSQFW